MSFVFGKELNSYLPKNLPPYSLIGYVNSNFAKDLKNQKLIISY